jgi:hypothetical protein
MWIRFNTLFPEIELNLQDLAFGSGEGQADMVRMERILSSLKNEGEKRQSSVDSSKNEVA